MSEWVSTKEKYPEKEGFYLCSTGANKPLICFFRIFNEKRSFIIGDGSHAIVNNIKYWATIPEVKEVEITQKPDNNFVTITKNRFNFLIQVLEDSIKIGENDSFKYLLVTRKSKLVDLLKKYCKYYAGHTLDK